MKNVLLIDDKDSIGKVVSIYLSKDYNFTFFDDPLKALEWLSEGHSPRLNYYRY
jgi:DNA-binding NtrC family response regulator